MKTTYAVVWREGGEPLASGRLEVRPRSVVLEGGRNGQPVEREIAFENLLTIRVGRSREDRLDGQPSLVLERRTGQAIRVASVAQPGIVSELAQRLIGLQLGREGATQRALVVVPLKEGSRERARELVDRGPPFEPERTGLARHHVFLLENQALFLFETDAGTRALEELLTEPDLWRSAEAWHEIVAGPPQIAEDAFSWVRPVPGGEGNGGEPHVGLGF
jgi:hypothetical protein